MMEEYLRKILAKDNWIKQCHIDYKESYQFPFFSLFNVYVYVRQFRRYRSLGKNSNVVFLEVFTLQNVVTHKKTYGKTPKPVKLSKMWLKQLLSLWRNIFSGRRQIITNTISNEHVQFKTLYEPTLYLCSQTPTIALIKLYEKHKVH